MLHRGGESASPGGAVGEGAGDADGAEGVEAVCVLDDGELGEAAQGGEVDGWVLGLGRVGDGGADDGDGDGDVGGPIEGDEVGFYGRGCGGDWDGRWGCCEVLWLGVRRRRRWRVEGWVDGGGGWVVRVHV